MSLLIGPCLTIVTNIMSINDDLVVIMKKVKICIHTIYNFFKF